MNRLYKNLQDILEQKIGLYESYLKLLNDEWKCISQYSYDDLEIIIAKKDDHVIQIQALENSRSSLMKKIAENLNTKSSGLTLKKLVQFKDNPYRENLANCRKKLLSNIQKINVLSKKIKSLMNYSTLSLKNSIAFIHSESEKAISPYESNGKVAGSKLQSTMVSVDV